MNKGQSQSSMGYKIRLGTLAFWFFYTLRYKEKLPQLSFMFFLIACTLFTYTTQLRNF